MARIKTVKTRRFTLPLKSSLSWGKGSHLEQLEHVLVQVITEDGHGGVAEAPARPTIYGETAESIEVIIRDHLAPGLIGLDTSNNSGIQEVLQSVKNNHTARAALDIAICEARARSVDKTLLETYRGSEQLPCSFILGNNTTEAMLAEARQVVEAGVRVFKVKVGRDPAQDLELLGALQHEFAGEAISLYADANETMQLRSAAKTIEALANLGVQYVEEPLPVHLVKARAQLQRDSILPIIADDSCFTLPDLERELDFDTFSYLNIKPARTGITTSLTMLELAQSAHKSVMFGSQAQSGLGTLHTAVLASRVSGLPHELSFPLKLTADTLDKPLNYHNGYLDLNDLGTHQLQPRFLLG